MKSSQAHKAKRLFLVILCLLALAVTAGATAAVDNGSGAESSSILVLTIRGPISSSVSEYIERGFSQAADSGAALVLIELDTPGGLDRSMRSINKNILNSPVPVVVYVSPSGARAASAGAFITVAADVAAMSPGTNIGAAHPVQLMGKQDETMAEKTVNDAAAYIRSIAEQRGRNGEMAEKTVRASSSFTEKEALEGGLIDVVSPGLDELLASIDGREISRSGETTIIHTGGKPLERLSMDLRRRILGILSDPTIAYLLLMLGMIGIYFELSNPGSILPGVIGTISIILALYSLQTLPVNYAGLLLIVLAVALFIAETQVAGLGLLALGGTIALLIGSLMLFRSNVPWLRLSLKVILPVVATTAAFFLIVMQRVVAAHRRAPSTGAAGIVGERGEALADLDPAGQVFVRGEIWEAESPDPVRKGDAVEVAEVKGLKLTVRHAKGG